LIFRSGIGFFMTLRRTAGFPVLCLTSLLQAG